MNIEALRVLVGMVMWIIDASSENYEKGITSLNWITDQSQKFDLNVSEYITSIKHQVFLC